MTKERVPQTPVENGAQARGFWGYRRRFRMSASMASRMKSTRVSFSRSKASISCGLPCGSGSVIRSGNSFFRPTRPGVPYVRFSVNTSLFRMYVIDLLTYVRYLFNRRYEWRAQ